jgi:hypothetical protein
LNFQIESADGFNFAVIGLAQVAALDDGGHSVILPDGGQVRAAAPESTDLLLR